MEALRAAWHGRNPRERTAIAFGGVSVAVLLIYGFVWEPLRAEHIRLRAALPHLRAEAAQFNADAAEAGRLRKIGHVMQPGASPRASVETAAKQTGVGKSIKSVTEVSGGRLQIVMDPVSYELLIRWVGGLTSNAGIAVESMHLRPGPAPGTVFVDTLVLKGYGAS
jgi:type II secretory pathway component PulM